MQKTIANDYIAKMLQDEAGGVFRKEIRIIRIMMTESNYSVPPHNMVASLKIIRKFISKL